MDPRNCGYCVACAHDEFDACTTFPKAREAVDPWREHLAKQAEQIDGVGLQLALTWMGSAHAGEGQEGFAARLAENVNRLIRAVADHKCATLASQASPVSAPHPKET